MELTAEQSAIIQSTGNIKINAVAGSGKTTTIIEYARARAKDSRILYLAFNRTVKQEAQKKFNDLGLSHVQVETAHSLAYKHIVPKYGYTIRAEGYKTHEIARLLGLKGDGEKHAEYIVANHIRKFLAYFCNSRVGKVTALNYLDVIDEGKARDFVKKYYRYIENQTRLLLNKMDQNEIEITHDFYLKKFQMANPHLNYDYILFDEGQDASEAMLDVILQQEKATKVIVGDMYQQIYGWRYAINALAKVDFNTYYLSHSFRFDSTIANLAKGILNWKKHLDINPSIEIAGLGQGSDIRSKAVLARTNLGLLLKAIETVTERNKITKLYFEGNIHSYTYADNGTSLYDVLNLYNSKRHMIRDKLIKSMKDIHELREYIENADEMQLALMIEIVKEYGNRIPGIIQNIKDKHVDDDKRDEAQLIFSTVHRSKGMEYDAVQLVNDFISEQKLLEILEERKNKPIPKNRLSEEINLLYVAVTRTKNSVHIPETLLPENIEPSPNIHKMKVLEEPAMTRQTNTQDKQNHTANETHTKSYTHESVRATYQKAYQPWTPALDDELEMMFCEGHSIAELAGHFGRTKGAIQSRIKKLELFEKYE